ncbi:MAG: Gfo/Idh/MocA family oxidoreductase, partial [Verrucomicrobiota bacterium]
MTVDRDEPLTGLERRSFLRRTGAMAVGTSLTTGMVRAGEEKEKIRLGLIGCGGRGKWIADLFSKNGAFQLVAVADYFQDRVDEVGKAFEVAEDRRFTGLDGYEQLLETSLDAVAIISPPFFHPEQAARAVAAGKHVFLAKPVAVDVPGSVSIEASGRVAEEKGLAFVVDFQTRADPLFQEAIKRVHDGALGDLCFGESLYHAGRLQSKGEPSDPGARLRNWVFDQALSGDIITEQNIHTLDVMNWIMKAPPLRATGSGGRKVRTDVGDCWDHFSLVFEYPDGVGVTFSSRQFPAHGTRGGIINRMFGSKGVLLTEYGGKVMIRGGKDAFYRGGETKQIYRAGCVANIGTFAT